MDFILSSQILARPKHNYIQLDVYIRFISNIKYKDTIA